MPVSGATFGTLAVEIRGRNMVVGHASEARCARRGVVGGAQPHGEELSAQNEAW